MVVAPEAIVKDIFGYRLKNKFSFTGALHFLLDIHRVLWSAPISRVVLAAMLNFLWIPIIIESYLIPCFLSTYRLWHHWWSHSVRDLSGRWPFRVGITVILLFLCPLVGLPLPLRAPHLSPCSFLRKLSKGRLWFSLFTSSLFFRRHHCCISLALLSFHAAPEHSSCKCP
jgi:hypothetical protein